MSEEEKFSMTERWRGGVDEKLRNIAEQCNRQGSVLDVVGDRVSKIELKVETLATRVSIFSAVSAILGSSIASLVIGIILKKQ